MKSNHAEPPVTETLAEEHGLTVEEYQKIRDILGRAPSFTELGIFSVMWSEHCSYKSSKPHLGKFFTNNARVIQGPGENAGVIDIGDDLAVVFKLESHNHPSFIEPFQGAATGVGGIIRDIFTMGARPIALMNSLRFGPMDIPKNRFILDGVVGGIASYGNCMGIPTVGGEVAFAPCYEQNPLVNVFCLGIAGHGDIFYGKATGEGNPVIYVGAKTGRDGIHGVSLLASAEFDEETEAKRPTVQVGDPFMEKLLMEACLEVVKSGYLVGMQDMGGAGLTCSTCEMGSRGDSGVDIDLRLIPQRETGMTPYELMLSESQERMLLVGDGEHENQIKEIFDKWDLHAITIGRVTSDGLLCVRKGEETVAGIPSKALADSAPVYDRPQRRPVKQDRILQMEPLPGMMPGGPEKMLCCLLGSPNIASKEYVYEQYDHMVRTNTIILPGSDAAVLRIKGTEMGLGMTLDGNSRYCYLDPYTGGMAAVAEACRNLVCAGAQPLAATNCLNFGNPEKPEIMWQFASVVEGIDAACRAFNTPITGGNVSFYNETLGKGIYPTPVLGLVGLLPDLKYATTRNFKAKDDIIVLLGDTLDELSGSEYQYAVQEAISGPPPALDLSKEKALQGLCLDIIREGLVHSAHDCSEGGLAVALAESCFAFDSKKGWGASITLKQDLPLPSLLFGETQGRVIISCAPEFLSRIEEMAVRQAVPFTVLGTVTGDRLAINCQDKEHIDIAISTLEETWRSAIGNLL